MIEGANERVNVGVVGTGSEGNGLVRQLATQPNARITSLCDIFEPNLQRGVRIAGPQTKTFTDYRKLIESKDVDAVLIATPLHLHADISLAALQAGKHVYVEKTMAYSASQCEQMVRAVKAHPSLVLQVGHQRRYGPMVRRSIEMARDGAIGKITHIRCNWHRNGSWRRPVPKSEFDPRPWGYADLEHLVNWRMYKKYSGGLMCELGAHMIEITNVILGAPPAAVTGFGGIDFWKDGRETLDNVVVVFNYPEGQKVIFSSITTNAHFGERIQVMGTEGTIDMSWDQALYFREKENNSEQLVRSEEATVITATGETMPAAPKGAGQATDVRPQARGRANPTYLALEAFVTCIRESKKPEVDVEVGRNAAVSVLMANQAMQQGRVVKFSEVAVPAKGQPASRKRS
jgi:predicted dehydrogenase